MIGFQEFIKSNRNMRVIGLMTIHYGKEYLKESLLSVKNHCEKIVVAYTSKPSHGLELQKYAQTLKKKYIK